MVVSTQDVTADTVLKHVRPATQEDNAALCSLMAHVPMEGDLVITSRREPDYFALPGMQKATAQTWVYDDGNGIGGMGSFVVRDGWLDGTVQAVGYLGDLRTRLSGRRSLAFPRIYGCMLDRFIQEFGCDHFLTGVLASNTLALRALQRQRRNRHWQPHYELLTPFDMVSIHFLGRRYGRWPSGLSVRTAVQEDLPAITSMLAADHRGRPFGYRFDDGEFEHRLARWPGFSLEQTYLCHAGARLVGLCTAWDPSPVKRYTVQSWRGPMRLARTAFNTAAHLTRWQPLPATGESFRYFYLCNISITDDNPQILRALLEAVHRDFTGRGHHFFALPMYDGDPLAPALRGFHPQRLRFNLYGVTPASRARTSWPGGRPGFEMALA